MADFSSILGHPDKEEIISRLLTGHEPKKINEWLKVKYPNSDQTHLILSVKLLKDFMKSPYPDYYNQVNTDLQKVKTEGKVSAALANNKTYQERLMAIVDTEFDMRTQLRGSLMAIHDRAIQLFDKIQENPEQYQKSEYAFIKYMETYFNGIEKYNKIINQAPDTIIQHNYTVQYIDQQAAHIQEAVKKVLSKMDPDNTLQLVAQFTEELSKLKAPEQEKLSQEDRLREAQYIKNEMVKLGESNE